MSPANPDPIRSPSVERLRERLLKLRDLADEWEQQADIDTEDGNHSAAATAQTCAGQLQKALDEFAAILSQPEPLNAAGEEARGSGWGLANVYMLARRRLMKLAAENGEREWWQHVVRISEEAGVRQPGVLRHSVPTEITDGGSSPDEGTRPQIEE